MPDPVTSRVEPLVLEELLELVDELDVVEELDAPGVGSPSDPERRAHAGRTHPAIRQARRLRTFGVIVQLYDECCALKSPRRCLKLAVPPRLSSGGPEFEPSRHEHCRRDRA